VALGVSQLNPDGPKQQLGGWGYQLLPYLEQENLWRDNTGQANIIGTPLRVFRCPSRGNVRIINFATNPFQQNHPGTGAPMWYPSYPASVAVAQTDYAANGGVFPGDPLSGAFSFLVQSNVTANPVRVSLKTFASYRKGQSNAVVIGEKLLNRAKLPGTEGGDLYGYAGNYTASTIRWSGDGGTYPYLQPQGDFSDPTSTVDSGGRFGSPHRGSVLFAFGDGSVRRVSTSVAGDVFYALCDVNNQRSVTESDYE
jgi:hypothetical protein